MANRYSVAGTSGTPADWDSTSTWSNTDGGAPGASVPVAGDFAFTKGNKYVNKNSGTAYCARLFVDGGHMTFAAGTALELTDTAGASLFISGSANSSLTIGSGVTFRSANPVPANPWLWRLPPFPTPYTDARLSYSPEEFTTSGMAVWLGWAYSGFVDQFYMNVPNAGFHAKCYDVRPAGVDIDTIYHRIPQRKGGRAYPGGSASRRYTVYGFTNMGDTDIVYLNRRAENNRYFGFTAPGIILPNCLMSNLRWNYKAGIAYFTFDLLEVV